MFACYKGQKDVVKLLLDHSERLELNARGIDDGETAFMYACSYGHKGIVQLLLNSPDKNIELSARNDGGWRLKEIYPLKFSPLNFCPQSTLPTGILHTGIFPEIWTGNLPEGIFPEILIGNLPEVFFPEILIGNLPEVFFPEILIGNLPEGTSPVCRRFPRILPDSQFIMQELNTTSKQVGSVDGIPTNSVTKPNQTENYETEPQTEKSLTVQALLLPYLENKGKIAISYVTQSNNNE